MALVADLHCHTTASGHAYSTVTEIAAQAAALGLRAVAITDHGPALPGSADMRHFANLNLLPTHILGVRILRGVEANIINVEGGLDLPDSLLEKLDVVIAGFHDIQVTTPQLDSARFLFFGIVATYVDLRLECRAGRAAHQQQFRFRTTCRAK